MRELIQFFTHLEQMQKAGVPLLDCIADIRDTSDNDFMRDVISEVYRDVSDGSSFSESLKKHPRVFDTLQTSLVSSGEETGNLVYVYQQLIKYMKWIDEMKTKVKKATRYPIFVGVFVLLTVTVMMGVVVPNIVGFIEAEMDTEIPFYTQALIDTSDFFREKWWLVLGTPVVLVVVYKMLRSFSDDLAFKFDAMKLKIPVMGELIRKINIARLRKRLAHFMRVVFLF